MMPCGWDPSDDDAEHCCACLAEAAHDRKDASGCEFCDGSIHLLLTQEYDVDSDRIQVMLVLVRKFEEVEPDEAVTIHAINYEDYEG